MSHGVSGQGANDQRALGHYTVDTERINELRITVDERVNMKVTGLNWQSFPGNTSV